MAKWILEIIYVLTDITETHVTYLYLRSLMVEKASKLIKLGEGAALKALCIYMQKQVSSLVLLLVPRPSLLGVLMIWYVHIPFYIKFVILDSYVEIK